MVPYYPRDNPDAMKALKLKESILWFKMASMDELSFKDIETMLKNVLGSINGTDTNDRDYTSICELWGEQLTKPGLGEGESLHERGKDLNWYTHAYAYWEDETNCPVSDDGVLGGYGALTPADSRGSSAFLEALRAKRPSLGLDTAADLGAGCGRVTKHFLLQHFQKVHLFEQSPRLVAGAPRYIGSPDAERVECHVQVLQDFKPAPETYDVIWIQWVIGHLHDLDYINFFRQCAIGLKPNGVICLKDNCTGPDVAFSVDLDDCSVARHPQYHRLLMILAGLNVELEQVQTEFPDELCPVHMWALSHTPPPSA